jgi:RHS repeat-associated protein
VSARQARPTGAAPSRRPARRSVGAALLAIACVGLMVAPALSAPADITVMPVPQLGADAPKAEKIQDGDVSVATQTGSLNAGYPITVPPGRGGMAPSIGLSYSSQGPIYGTLAAGWSLSGLPDIRIDPQASALNQPFPFALRSQPENLRYVSGLAGGRPLILTDEVKAAGVAQTFRAQNDATFSRYELMSSTAASFAFRVKSTDGTVHTFGDKELLVGGQSVTSRFPLTRSVDQFGNTVEYLWSRTNDDYQIVEIRYGMNSGAGVPNALGKVTFTWVDPDRCDTTGGNQMPIGSALDLRSYGSLERWKDSTRKLTKVTVVALDTNGTSVLHTREINLGYADASNPAVPVAERTEDCTRTFSPFRQLRSIQESAWHTGALPTERVDLPAVTYRYGSPDIQRTTATSTALPWGGQNRINNLGWGTRPSPSSKRWPSVEAMLIDIDGDGALDRLEARTSGNECVADFYSSRSGIGSIQLPRMPWSAGNTMGLNESCSLNGQMTKRYNTTNNCTGDANPNYFVYRWLDIDGDGLVDLVSAIHHDPFLYDPNKPGEPVPTGVGAWPTCSAEPECPVLDGGRSPEYQVCAAGQSCVGDDLAWESLVGTAPQTVGCDQMLRLSTGAGVGSGGQTIEPPPPVDCASQARAHSRCGKYPWLVYKNLGGGNFATTPTIKMQPAPLESESGDSALSGGHSIPGVSQSVFDIDGDGYPDYIARPLFTGQTNPVEMWMVFLNDGTGQLKRAHTTLPAPYEWLPFAFSVPANIWTSEFRGLTIAGSPDRMNVQHGMPFDANGDGLVDFLHNGANWSGNVPPTGSPKVYLSNGRGFLHTIVGGEPMGDDRWPAALDVITKSRVVTTATVPGAIQGPQAPLPPPLPMVATGDRYALRQFVDWDEDGRPDLTETDIGTGVAASIRFSDGSTPLSPVSVGTTFTSALRSQMRAEADQIPQGPFYWTTLTGMVDLDGDGISDRIDFTGGSMQRHVHNHAGAPPRLLTEIKNGRGLTTTITYAPTTDQAVVTQVTGNPATGVVNRTMPKSQWVVKSITEADQFETSSTIEYQYKRPYVGKDDRGRYAFRGFEEVWTKGPVTPGGQSLTIEKYGFNVDWSGRKSETQVRTSVAGGPTDANVHSISTTSYTTLTLFGGKVITFHPFLTETFQCKNNQTDGVTGCRSPTLGAGYTRVLRTYADKASDTSTTGKLLWVEADETLQAGIAWGVGDRKTTSTFVLHANADVYRLRPELTESQVQEAGGLTTYRKSRQVWDPAFDFRVLSATETWLDATTTATVKFEYYQDTGNLKRRIRPTNGASGIGTLYTYDAKQLFVATTTPELGGSHAVDTVYDYGTGALLSTKGPNVRTCTASCTGPVKEEKNTYVDGLGRPRRLEETQTESGANYLYRDVGRFTYVDSVVGSTPTSVRSETRLEWASATPWTDAKTELDGRGRPTRTTTVTAASGTAVASALYNPVTTFDYDAAGELVSVNTADPSQVATATSQGTGVTYNYSYDSLGRPTMLERPEVSTGAGRTKVLVSYSSLDETRTEVTDSSGGPVAQTITTTDAFGRLVKVKEAKAGGAFSETRYDYSPDDNVSRVTQETDLPQVVTDLTHDWAGHRTKVARAGREWKYTYTLDGDLWCETSPGAPNPASEPLWTTCTTYDVQGRPTLRELAKRTLSGPDQDAFATGRWEMDWDAAGNRIGRLVTAKLFPPNSNTPALWEEFMYDAQGNVSATSHRGNWGNTALATWDRKNVRKFHPGGRVAELWYYDYAVQGGATTVSKGNFYYDRRGLPAKVNLLLPGQAAFDLGVQTRNGAGLVTKRRSTQAISTFPWIEAVWGYDKLGRVTSQAITRGTGATTQTTVGSQVLSYFGGDDPKQLDHTVAGATMKRFGYSYDERHQLIGVTETSAGGAFGGTYGFRDSGRLQHATITAQALTGSDVKPRTVYYNYGAGGADPEAVTSLTNGTTAGGSTYASYLYDDAGNQTQRTVLNGAGTADDEVVDFVYDGDDQLRRMTKKVGGATVAVEEYQYDHGGQRVAVLRRNPSTNAVLDLRWFLGGTEWLFPATGTTASKTYAYVSMGTPVARVVNRGQTVAGADETKWEFQFHGLAGSTLATVQQNTGVINAGFVYGPYGEIVQTVGAATSVGQHRRRLNDKYFDEASGLGYYGARYYDKLLMGWTQADPLYRVVPEAGGAGPRMTLSYAFTLNNPLSFVDPDGLSTSLPGGGIQTAGSEAYRQELASQAAFDATACQARLGSLCWMGKAEDMLGPIGSLTKWDGRISQEADDLSDEGYDSGMGSDQADDLAEKVRRGEIPADVAYSMIGDRRMRKDLVEGLGIGAGLGVTLAENVPVLGTGMLAIQGKYGDAAVSGLFDLMGGAAVGALAKAAKAVKATQVAKRGRLMLSVGAAEAALPKLTKAMKSKSRIIAEGTAIRKVEKLVATFGGKAKKWVKKGATDPASGAEVHWYEHPGIGVRGLKWDGFPDPF